MILAGGILAFLVSPLAAQVMPGEPPPSGYARARSGVSVPPQGGREAIHSYLCMQRRIAALRARMETRKEAAQALRRRLAVLDARLRREHPRVAVNNPRSVGHYKALLERRDALEEHSWRPAVMAARQATFRYNAAVHAYNARYASRPFDAARVAQVRATLSCRPLR